MRLIIFFSFLLLSISSGFAQQDSCNFSVHGTILDEETKEPVPYATIQIDGTKKAAITDIHGHFHIHKLCSPDVLLRVMSYGYEDTTFSYHTTEEEVVYFLSHETFEFEGVVIHGEQSKTKGTESISQLTVKKVDLQSDATQSLAAALSEQNGVTFTSTGSNVQLPVIHGLYGNRILILNNGLKHGLQNWGKDHAPEIDISSAHKVTIIKGAAGVRFGPEALGGAINVMPNPLYFNKPIYAEVETGFQSNGRGFNTRFETGQGFNNWSYFLGGNFTKIGDRHAPDYILTNSGKEEIAFNFGTRYRANKWEYKLYYSFVDQNLALLRSSVAESANAFIEAINATEPRFIRPFSYDINEPNQLTQHHYGKGEIGWQYNQDAKLTFRTGIQYNQRVEYDVRRNADKPIIDLDLRTADYQLEWNHSEIAGWNGVIGGQFFTQNSDNNPGTGVTPFIPNYNTYRTSGFIVESKKMGENTLEIGVRFDNELTNVRGRMQNQEAFKDEYSFANFTGSVGYVWRITEKSKLRSNIGTAWRTPNVAELFSFGQHGFKTTYGLLRYYTNDDGEFKTDKVIPLGESDVKPEKGYKWITTYETDYNRNNINITGYAHYIENYIYDRPVGVLGTFRGPMPAFIFVQSDAVFLGADFNWKREWTEDWDGNFGFSYLWSKNISKNEPLINQPPITTFYKLGWHQPPFWKFGRSEWFIRPSYTFQQFNAPRTIPPEDLVYGVVEITPESEIFDFKDAPDGYFLLDVGWSFGWHKWSGSITVKNVFNTRYRDYLNEMRYFADEPGTNVLVTLKYRFSNEKIKENN